MYNSRLSSSFNIFTIIGKSSSKLLDFASDEGMIKHNDCRAGKKNSHPTLKSLHPTSRDSETLNWEGAI